MVNKLEREFAEKIEWIKVAAMCTNSSSKETIVALEKELSNFRLFLNNLYCYNFITEEEHYYIYNVARNTIDLTIAEF